MTKNQLDKSNPLMFHNSQESLNYRLLPYHTITHTLVPARQFKAQGPLTSGNEGDSAACDRLRQRRDAAHRVILTGSRKFLIPLFFPLKVLIWVPACVPSLFLTQLLEHNEKVPGLCPM